MRVKKGKKPEGGNVQNLPALNYSVCVRVFAGMLVFVCGHQADNDFESKSDSLILLNVPTAFLFFFLAEHDITEAYRGNRTIIITLVVV